MLAHHDSILLRRLSEIFHGKEQKRRKPGSAWVGWGFSDFLAKECYRSFQFKGGNVELFFTTTIFINDVFTCEKINYDKFWLEREWSVKYLIKQCACDWMRTVASLCTWFAQEIGTVPFGKCFSILIKSGLAKSIDLLLILKVRGLTAVNVLLCNANQVLFVMS